ncbi:MAG: hypothetical protein FWG30_06305 [Eubacteriaceae bacterium]|nr:hypothetical protein [Eubacteriaceae bacterium]
MLLAFFQANHRAPDSALRRSRYHGLTGRSPNHPFDGWEAIFLATQNMH